MTNIGHFVKFHVKKFISHMTMLYPNLCYTCNEVCYKEIALYVQIYPLSKVTTLTLSFEEPSLK